MFTGFAGFSIPHFSSILGAISITAKVDGNDYVDGSELLNDATVVVTLAATTPADAEIRYTTNGDAPTADSTLYADPIEIKAEDVNGKTITLKVIGAKSGYTNSAVAEKVFKFLPTDQAAADAVDTLITALPAAGSVTLGDKTDIEGARAAYDALTPAQQALVAGLAALEAAEAELSVLEGAVLSNDASVKSVKVKDKDATAGEGNTYTVELAHDAVLSDLTKNDIVVESTDTKAAVGEATTNDSGATWTVEVTAEDGTKVTYTISVTVVAPNPETLKVKSVLVEQKEDEVIFTIEAEGDDLARLRIDFKDNDGIDSYTELLAVYANQDDPTKADGVMAEGYEGKEPGSKTDIFAERGLTVKYVESALVWTITVKSNEHSENYYKNIFDNKTVDFRFRAYNSSRGTSSESEAIKEETVKFVYYTVSFKDGEDITKEQIRVLDGKTIDSSRMPQLTDKLGYVFLGWTTNKGISNPTVNFNDEYQITKDITVYPVWGSVATFSNLTEDEVKECFPSDPWGDSVPSPDKLNFSIDENNNNLISINGELNFVEKWQEFNKSVVEQQSGYYAFIRIGEIAEEGLGGAAGYNVILILNPGKENEKMIYPSQLDEVNDKKILALAIWIAGEGAEDTNKKTDIKVNWNNNAQTKTYTLDFSGLTLKKND